jgi:hypothetical protein
MPDTLHSSFYPPVLSSFSDWVAAKKRQSRHAPRGNVRLADSADWETWGYIAA